MNTQQTAFETAQAKSDRALAHMETVRHEAPEVSDAAWRAYCEANDEARALYVPATVGSDYVGV